MGNAESTILLFTVLLPLIAGSVSITIAWSWTNGRAKATFITFAVMAFIAPSLLSLLSELFMWGGASIWGVHLILVLRHVVVNLSWVPFLLFATSAQSIFTESSNLQQAAPVYEGPVWDTKVDKKELKELSTKRNLAFVVDNLPLLVTVSGFSYLMWTLMQDDFSRNFRSLLSIVFTFLGLLALLYLLFKDSIGGQSIGKKLLGCRVVSSKTGRPIGPLDSVTRNFVFVFPFGPLIELCVAKFRTDGRRLGDLMVETQVVSGDPATIDGIPVPKILSEKKHALDD